MKNFRQFLRFAAVTNAAVLFQMQGGAALADAISGDSVTINPTTTGSVPVLDLQSLADPLLAPGAPGTPNLTLSYSDSAIPTVTTGPAGFFILNRPDATLEWHIANADGSTRLQMQLGSGNSLTLWDPANTANGIVLMPGGSTPGVFLNGSPFLTQSVADQRYLGVNGGNVVLGGSGSQTISGNGSYYGSGNSLTIKAADADTSPGSIGYGGTLVLSSGASVGGPAIGSQIEFRTASAYGSGTQVNTPETRMKLTQNGSLLIGSGAGVGGFGQYGGLDVSFSGAPATIMIGADPYVTTRTVGVDKWAAICMPTVDMNPTNPTVLMRAQETVGWTWLWLGGVHDSTSVTDIFLTTATDPTVPVSSTDPSTGGTRLYINRWGQVGIGTTSPAAQLHVADSMQVDGAATFNGGATINGVVHIQAQGDISMGDFAN